MSQAVILDQSLSEHCLNELFIIVVLFVLLKLLGQSSDHISEGFFPPEGVNLHAYLSMTLLYFVLFCWYVVCILHKTIEILNVLPSHVAHKRQL